MDNITADDARPLRELALFAGAGGVSSEGNSLDGKQSALSSLIPTLQRCYVLGRTTEFSRLSQYGMTCEASTETLGKVASILFPEAFPARTFPALAKAPESTEPEAACGENLRELSARFDPDSCSWKTATSLLSEDLSESSVILPRSGTMRNGKLWERTTSAPRIAEKDCGSLVWIGTPTARASVRSENFRAGRLPTPAEFAERERFLTPTATDARRTTLKLESLRKRYAKHPQGNLAEQIAMFPTPRTKGMCGGTGSLEQMNRLQEAGVISEHEKKKMTAGNGGALNPTWVEWLMGWPLEWTDLRPLGTDRFLSWLRQHSIGF